MINLTDRTRSLPRELCFCFGGVSPAKVVAGVSQLANPACKPRHQALPCDPATEPRHDTLLGDNVLESSLHVMSSGPKELSGHELNAATDLVY